MNHYREPGDDLWDGMTAAVCFAVLAMVLTYFLIVGCV